MNGNRKVTVTVAAILFGVATAAFGQAGSVEKQLASKVEAQRKVGMVQAGPDSRGSLDNKKSGEDAVYLIKGVRYQLTGFCDNDCRRLDISLVDGSNVEVAKHTTADDTPVLNVTPAATGKYTLRVVMVECTVDPCDWSVRVYAPR
jgi:hypothetical protein